MGDPCPEAELLVDEEGRGSPARGGPSGEVGSEAGAERGVSDVPFPGRALRCGDDGSLNGFGGSYGGVIVMLGIGEVCP